VRAKHGNDTNALVSQYQRDRTIGSNPLFYMDLFDVKLKLPL
jgi:hypothetical protein